MATIGSELEEPDAERESGNGGTTTTPFGYDQEKETWIKTDSSDPLTTLCGHRRTLRIDRSGSTESKIKMYVSMKIADRGSLVLSRGPPGSKPDSNEDPSCFRLLHAKSLLGCQTPLTGVVRKSGQGDASSGADLAF
ncbi:hypothetical protein AVEN_50419-1 [Araneus ventricosus]|uniref:Uncharacterized protein n=1 Tax=Araneus ventricosus TaxID=182803 RepID=A0A4Y2EQX1_ARAVE|nr:hypothetical protein AVEN_50419-1 [Araneus ventricosus]